MIHHRAWTEGVDRVLHGLNASLLTIHPETKVCIYFSLQVYQFKTLLFGKMYQYCECIQLNSMFFVFVFESNEINCKLQFLTCYYTVYTTQTLHFNSLIT